MTAYPPIENYAIIGNCGTAALVSLEGSLDWLCLPRFDSSWVFGALLDAKKGGRFRIRPVGEFVSSRRYLDGTNVLETTFEADGGVLRLTDLMPVLSTDDSETVLRPQHEVLRRIECVEGKVEVEVDLDPRLDYSRRRARFTDRGHLGYFCNHRNQVLAVRTEFPLELSEDRGALKGRATLEPGEAFFISFAFEEGEPIVLLPLGDGAERRVAKTVDYWRDWISLCTYHGKFEGAVQRSALALKLMTYSRSGAVVAAPTSSLPENIGGERNWDYRFCWLRDASFTLRALYELGYEREARTFSYWLLYAAGGTKPHLHVLYDLHGTTHIDEKVLDYLEGYRGSRPVRIGNGAKDQLQLDIFGEVVSAVHGFVKREGELSSGQRRILRSLGETVTKRWREPDAGIWEMRAEPSHHTYSKVMCWVALDRLIDLHENRRLDIDVKRFAAVREEIREEVESRGFNERLGSYVSVFDGDQVDASLLLLPTYGFVDANDPRMRATFELIEKRLARGPLVYRYSAETDDGLPEGEGAFGICSFWDEAYMARLGKVEEAEDALAETIAYSNDVGLFAEEIDPQSGSALGNFPQAFTHVGLINAALTIEEAAGRRKESGQEEPLDRAETS